MAAAKHPGPKAYRTFAALEFYAPALLADGARSEALAKLVAAAAARVNSDETFVIEAQGVAHAILKVRMSVPAPGPRPPPPPPALAPAPAPAEPRPRPRPRPPSIPHYLLPRPEHYAASPLLHPSPFLTCRRSTRCAAARTIAPCPSQPRICRTS